MDYLNTPNTGESIMSDLSPSGTTVDGANATVTIPSGGFAVLEFKVGMQPGNNYRIAAEFSEYGSNTLNSLRVSTQNSTYVSPDDKQIPGLIGVISPMLTVWRKLHIEQDSMGAVQTSGMKKISSRE